MTPMPHTDRIPDTDVNTSLSLSDHGNDDDSNDVILHELTDHVLCRSYLYKKSKYTQQWQKKWVVLRNNQLSYYKDSNEHRPIKVINKLDLQSFSYNSNHFDMYTGNRILHFKTHSDQDFNIWITALNEFFQLGNNKPGADKSGTGLNKSETGLNKSETDLINIKIPLLEDSYSNRYTRSNSEFSAAGQNTSSPESSTSSSRSNSCYNVSTGKLTNICENEEYQGYEYMIESGYTKKLSNKSRSWKQYYLVLTNKNLYLLNNDEELIPHEIIPNVDLTDVIELDPINKSKSWCLLVVTSAKTMKFATKDEPDMVKWLSALKTISVLNGHEQEM